MIDLNGMEANLVIMENLLERVEDGGDLNKRTTSAERQAIRVARNVLNGEIYRQRMAATDRKAAKAASNG